MSDKFVIGIDGGGTTTHVIFAGTDGRVLKEFHKGALNINGQGRGKAAEVLKEILLELSLAGLKKEDCAGTCIGVAGISNSDTAAVIADVLKKEKMAGKVKIVGDHEIALTGAFNKFEGIILVAGTGSICFGTDKRGNQFRAGGYGHIIDDVGSAYAISKEMLKAIVRGHDGRGIPTILTQKVLEQVEVEGIDELITWLYAPQRTKKDIAELAVLLEDGIMKKDKISLAIRREQVMGLVALAKAVLAHFEKEEDMAVSGSVLLKNEEIFRMFCEIIHLEYPKLNIHKLKGSAAEGAIRTILGELGYARSK